MVDIQRPKDILQFERIIFVNEQEKTSINKALHFEKIK